MNRTDDTVSDEWLEQLLDEEPYIPDEGFTELVMTSLPKPLSTRTRAAVLTGLCALASLLVLGIAGPDAVVGVMNTFRWEGGLPTASMGLALMVLAGLAFTPAMLASDD